MKFSRSIFLAFSNQFLSPKIRQMPKRIRDLPDGFPLCGVLIRPTLWTNSINELRRLLELKCDPNHENPINRVDFVGWNPHGFEAVKLLLEYKADPNKREDECCTAAMDSARYNKPEILKLLIQHKADINLKSSYNWTCLDYAIEAWNMDCAMLLLQHGGKRVKNVENEFVSKVRKDYTLLVIDQVSQWTHLQPRDVIVIIVDYGCEHWEIQ